MKFCKDCAHFTLPYAAAPLHLGLCSRKEANRNPVTGASDGPNDYVFCKVERVSLAGNCGHEAKYFKPMFPEATNV